MITDDQIRDAGARLSAVVVRVPEPSRVLQRRSGVRSIAIVGSLALVATAVGFARWSVRADDTARTASSPIEQCSNADTYQLQSDRATALPVERLTATTADSVVWVDNTDATYLTLTVRPGVAAIQPTPTGVGPMTQDTSLPESEGQAWFTTATTDRTRQLNMWWARNNGDLWLLAGYWYGPDDSDIKAAHHDLRERALAISISQPDQPYVLADPNMQLLASERAGEVASRAFVWNYTDDMKSTKLILLVIDDSAASGRANLLATGKPERVIIGGCAGWKTTATNGDVHIGWTTAQDNVWATFTIPATLAAAANELAAALHGN